MTGYSSPPPLFLRSPLSDDEIGISLILTNHKSLGQTGSSNNDVL